MVTVERKELGSSYHPLVGGPQRIFYEYASLDSLRKWQQEQRLPMKHALVRAWEIFEDRGDVLVVVNSTSYGCFLSKESQGLEAPSPLSVGALTFSSDGFLVLGQRSQNVGTEKGKIHLIPAGYMEWRDVGNLTGLYKDPHEHTLKRELYEELGIRRYLDARVLGIINRDSLDNPMIIFLLKLPHSKSRLLRIREKKQATQTEHANLIFIKKGEIEDFCDDQAEKLTDHLKGALLFYEAQTRGLSLSLVPLLFPRPVKALSLRIVVGNEELVYRGTKNLVP